MAKPPRDRLAQFLVGSDRKTSHSASVRMAADSLELGVEGVGRISLPVKLPQAKKLIAAARPAHFGKGEETLLDASVRDTWEITPAQVTLGGERWEAVLTAALEELADQLGIPEHTHLRPDLHSMLIYGKGQFFAPHQDSEKHDDMVATLVVSLPSAHTGGELVIDDDGTFKRYAGSREDLVLVAFYADRRHEVKPVRSGTRVTLTFNLLLEQSPSSRPQGPADQAKSLVQAHFATPTKASSWDTPAIPERLVLLLDHEYSQRSLDAKRLKGKDAERVALLSAAASAAGCEWALAQCEIQETRDAVVSRGYRGYDDYFDDEEFDDDPDDVEAGELIDASTVLTWWDDHEAGGAIHLSVAGREILDVTPSTRLTPYASEYEGYMGNYGNTIDRWYRRGALVMWPTDTSFATRAAANLEWALGQALAAIRAGEIEQAQSQVRAITRQWGAASGVDFATALELACGVDDPDLALDVLAPFALVAVSPNDAPGLAELARRYPAAWWPELRRRWERRHSSLHEEWVARTLESLGEELDAVGAALVADWLIAWVTDWATATISATMRLTHVVQRAARLDSLGPALAALLTMQSEQGRQAVCEQLASLSVDGMPLVLAALRSLPSPVPSGLGPLIDEAHAQLGRQVALPQRTEDDWSIAWSSPGGADEDQLAQFLNAAERRVFEWPLAERRRQRIHNLIDQADLPMTHKTRRVGRPYTLVLTKTSELFTREREARARAEADLAWLAGTFGTEVQGS